jgi:hypothetical protein
MTVQIRFPRIQEHLNKAKPPKRFGLLDPKWEYVPAASTDVQKTWREHGWKPQGEKQ